MTDLESVWFPKYEILGTQGELLNKSPLKPFNYYKLAAFFHEHGSW